MPVQIVLLFHSRVVKEGFKILYEFGEYFLSLV